MLGLTRECLIVLAKEGANVCPWEMFAGKILSSPEDRAEQPSYQAASTRGVITGLGQQSRQQSVLLG